MRTRPEPWLVIFTISPLRGPRRLDDHADEVLRDVDGEVLDRLHELAVDDAGDDLRPADHQLVAFAAHHLDEDGELQFAAAQHLEAVRRAGLLDADGDVGQQLLVEALAQIAAR